MHVNKIFTNCLSPLHRVMATLVNTKSNLNRGCTLFVTTTVVFSDDFATEIRQFTQDEN